MKDFIEGLGLSIQEILIIILPGIATCYFINSIKYFNSVINLFDNPTSLIGGIKLFAVAYFVGYVIYVLSSYFDSIYNWLKEKKLDKKFNNAKTDEGLDYIDLNLEENFFKRIYIPYAKESNNLIVKVTTLKPSNLRFELNGTQQNFFNAYQYATRVLLDEAPAMYMEVYRYYATARFFRSMTLVFLLGLILRLFEEEIKLPVGLLIMCIIISFYVFTARWRKAQNVAYKNFIIYETRKQKSK